MQTCVMSYLYHCRKKPHQGKCVCLHVSKKNTELLDVRKQVLVYMHDRPAKDVSPTRTHKRTHKGLEQM